MVTDEESAEQPWDRPLRRIQRIEAQGHQDLLKTGDSDAVQGIKDYQRQWTNTQLPTALLSWAKMDSDTKRQYIDTMVELAERLKAATGLPAEECGAKAIAQMVEMLGDMTPEHRDYAHQAAKRIIGYK